MKSSSHDTIVYRLAQILIKLNHGEKLDPLRLADEFGVNLRTIQRDLNERFAYLPLQKNDGRYHLDPVFLGKLSSRDIQRFATLSGLKGLFPSLGEDFLRDIFDTRTQEALLIKGHNFEDMTGKELLFRGIEEAIIAHKCVSFVYQKSGETTNYESLSPYKLLNLKGIWYLAATDCGKLKTFSLAKIDRLRVMDSKFLWSEEITARLAAEEGIWFTEQQHDVLIEVSAEVASYFRRRKLIANQVIEKETPDGRLLISSKVGHPNQVLPIIRYWIPHIRIIRPALWQEELAQSLKDYLWKINCQ
jgi:predicted DNA-binding transcriptional regulator YafY